MITNNRLIPISPAIVILLAVAFVVATTTYKGKATASRRALTELQQPADKDVSSEWAQCETYCDPYKPGTSTAEIRWRVSPQDLNTNELLARTTDEVLEVSVYKDGFDRNLYANVQTREGIHGFSLLNVQPAQRRIPGLDRLVLIDMTTSAGDTQGFRMMAEDPEKRGGEWAVAKVQGLRPGMVYFWRVRNRARGDAPPGVTVVRCRAAICPVDSQRRTRR